MRLFTFFTAYFACFSSLFSQSAAGDSIRVYPFDGEDRYARSVCASPFERGKFWIFFRHGAEEFDATTGQTTGFFQKIKGWQNDSIELHLAPSDPFEPSVQWLFGRNLVRWLDATRLESALFSLSPSIPRCFFFDQKSVWIGTTAGLWQFDRASKRLALVPRSPRDEISRIERGPTGKLIFRTRSRDIFEYDEPTQCMARAAAYRGLEPDSIRQISESAGLVAVWLNGGEHPYFFETAGAEKARFGFCRVGCDNWRGTVSAFDLEKCEPKRLDFWPLEKHPRCSFAEANGEIWFDFGLVFGVFSKKDGSSRLWRQPFGEDNSPHLATDGERLFRFAGRSITVAGLDFLKTRPEDGRPFLAKKYRFERLVDSLDLKNHEDWIARRAKMEQFKKAFPDERDPYFLEQIRRFDARVTMPFDSSSLHFLLHECRDSVFVGCIFFLWKRDLARECRFEALQNLYEKMATHLDSFEKSEKIALDSMLLEFEKMDSTATMPEAERLWQKGRLAERFLNENIFLWGSDRAFYGCFEFFFEAILNRFPSSERADDVAFRHSKLSIFDFRGQLSEAAIEENHCVWETFLAHFPRSEFRAEALANWAYWLGHFGHDHFDYPDLARERLDALEEAARLRPDLFEKNKYGSSWHLQQLEKARSAVARFDLEADFTMKKAQIRVGESVEMTASITNRSRTDHEFSMYERADLPNFQIEIREFFEKGECLAPLRFLENEAQPLAQEPTKKRLLRAGEPFSEQLVLTEKVLSGGWPGRLGRFVFERPGVYEITVHWLFDSEKRSSPMRLTVVE